MLCIVVVDIEGSVLRRNDRLKIFGLYDQVISSSSIMTECENSVKWLMLKSGNFPNYDSRIVPLFALQ
jgi:hypothetical protein